MSLELEAIYQQGCLRLTGALPLRDGERVKITIHPTGTAVDRLHGMINWTGSQADLDYLLGPDNHPAVREE
jgi:predicted DNA-binding antitoxin AbrB/MazE fold protein